MEKPIIDNNWIRFGKMVWEFSFHITTHVRAGWPSSQLTVPWQILESEKSFLNCALLFCCLTEGWEVAGVWYSHRTWLVGCIQLKEKSTVWMDGAPNSQHLSYPALGYKVYLNFPRSGNKPNALVFSGLILPDFPGNCSHWPCCLFLCVCLCVCVYLGAPFIKHFLLSTNV